MSMPAKVFHASTMGCIMMWWGEVGDTLSKHTRIKIRQHRTYIAGAIPNECCQLSVSVQS